MRREDEVPEDEAFAEFDGFEELDTDADGDDTLVTEAEVRCPHCGEPNAIAVDPGGGTAQDYVEDCQVCCRPWTVHVRLDEQGTAEVWVEAAYE